MRNFILVTGLGRSGTTIVQQLLSAIPGGYCCPESWALLSSVKNAMSERNQLILGVDEVFKLAARQSIMFYNAVAEKHNATNFIADKIPPFFTNMPKIVPFWQYFYPTTLITCVRHPYDVICSWIERFGDKTSYQLSFYGSCGDKTIVQALFAAWTMSLNAHSVYGGKKILVKYEDLVTGGAGALCDFLDADVSCISSALSSNAEFGDPKFNDHKKFHTNSINRWLKEEDGVKKILIDESPTKLIKTMEMVGYAWNH